MNRKQCVECPWNNESKHNRSLINSIIRWFKNGSRKTIQHRCHMIDSNLWKEVNKNNICIGSKNFYENNEKD